MIQTIALIASVTIPLWNIPLVVRMIQRKSSDDISLAWAIGVWVSFALMAPQGFVSEDIVWKAFSIINFFAFTVVASVVVYYRIKKPKTTKDPL